MFCVRFLSGKVFFSIMTKQVLIAEDSESIRDRLDRLVSQLGYGVIQAQDGQEAWEQIQTNNIDLLVTDIQMPNIDGYTLIGKLQEGRYKIPVIVHSAKFDSAKAPYDGTIDYFKKPFDSRAEEGKFQEKVRELLG